MAFGLPSNRLLPHCLGVCLSGPKSSARDTRPHSIEETIVIDKYQPLWEYVAGRGEEALTLSFDDIESILGFPIDHSFLNCKKDLSPFGFAVGKISLKGKTVCFKKMPGVSGGRLASGGRFF